MTNDWVKGYPKAAGDRAYARVVVKTIGGQAPNLSVSPGQMLLVNRVQFNYQGPQKRLVFGFALKPDYGRGGVNWDNGVHTIPDLRAITVFTVPDSPNMTSYDSGVNLSLPQGVLPFGFSAPAPGIYVAQDGGSGKINSGPASTWVWVSDGDQILQEGHSQLDFLIASMVEHFQLRKASGGAANDTDANVFIINA